MSLALHAAPVEHEQSNSSGIVRPPPDQPGKVESVKKRMNVKSFDDDEDDTNVEIAPTEPPPETTGIGPDRWSSQGAHIEPFEPISIPTGDSEKQATTNTDKLDYLIHLLESQNDVKNGSVTEDLILYSFLGIFIIFVLDNFNRAGKYCR